MCGFLGRWHPDRSDDLERRVTTSLDLLAHRGPDGRAVFVDHKPFGSIVLGHTRLSIIDLTEGGTQPMASSDGRYVIVYNGEIYNYRELRAELQAEGWAFKTASDSEVLLSSWIRWGPAVLPRLVGMFAFVVYDRVAGTLTAVRDAFGIKPFFFTVDGGGLAFASELPALLSLMDAEPRLDRQRAHDYLVYAIHEVGGDSFVEGVHVLPPAHLVEVSLEPGGTEAIPRRWWQPAIGERSWRFSDAVDAVREQFLASVRLHMRSDVPVGAALSGGIDSSALVCAMRHVEPDLPIHTFSYIPADRRLSEEPWIDLVNAHVGASVHKIRVSPGELERDLADVIRTQGEPFGTTTMYAQYRVFQAAREHGVVVVLEGQGADELMGGYEGYPGPRALSLLEGGQFSALASFARHWPKWPGREGRSVWRALVGQLLPQNVYHASLSVAGVQTAPPWIAMGALVDEGVSIRPIRVPRGQAGRGRRLAETLAYSLTNTYLPTLVRYGDRNAMRFSIENRVPFLTIPMADLLLSMPESYLVSPAGETKSVFRAAMRGLVPDPILDRRDKIGFETPIRDWLRGAAPQVRQVLDATTQYAFLSPPTMRLAFDAMLSEAGPVARENATWRLINLCWWSSVFGVR